MRLRSGAKPMRDIREDLTERLNAIDARYADEMRD